MAPAVSDEFPPRAASGARSRTSTLHPFSSAACAAHSAAWPAPTKTRSNDSDMDAIL